MKNKLGINDVKRLAFMTDSSYLMHLGDHFEDQILKAREDMEPVIRIINVNGCPSAIPLERALYLLEKYYKISGKKVKKKDNIIAIQPDASQSDEDTDSTMAEERKQMA